MKYQVRIKRSYALTSYTSDDVLCETSDLKLAQDYMEAVKHRFQSTDLASNYYLHITQVLEDEEVKDELKKFLEETKNLD